MQRSLSRLMMAMAIVLLAALLPALLPAQSIWVDRNHNKSFALEILKPSFKGEDNTTFITSALFLSLRYPIVEKVRVVAELPFAHLGYDAGFGNTESENTFGNPYFGIEMQISNSPVFAEVGVRAPIAPDDDEKNGGAALVAALLLWPFVNLFAQEAQPIVPGARVRVSAWSFSSDWLIGSVVLKSADTLRLAVDNANAPVTIPLAAVTRLDVSRGRTARGKNALKGAGIGLVIGGLGGFVVDAVVEGDQSVAPLVGMIGGAFNGSLIGASGKSAAIGFLSGLAVGAAIGLALDEEGDDTDAATWTLIGAALGGEIGILLVGIPGLASDADYERTDHAWHLVFIGVCIESTVAPALFFPRSGGGCFRYYRGALCACKI